MHGSQRSGKQRRTKERRSLAQISVNRALDRFLRLLPLLAGWGILLLLRLTRLPYRPPTAFGLVESIIDEGDEDGEGDNDATANITTRVYTLKLFLIGRRWHGSPLIGQSQIIY